MLKKILLTALTCVSMNAAIASTNNDQTFSDNITKTDEIVSRYKRSFYPPMYLENESCVRLRCEIIRECTEKVAAQLFSIYDELKTIETMLGEPEDEFEFEF